MPRLVIAEAALELGCLVRVCLAEGKRGAVGLWSLASIGGLRIVRAL